MESPSATGDNVLVRLLDSSRGHTLQQWKFESVSAISIGRAPEREIVIPDARISRMHVVLEKRGDHWWLVSHGQNGVQIDGQTVTEYRLAHGTSFRLGAQGPMLEFSVVTAPTDSLKNTLVTMQLDDDPQIQLDSGKLNADVQEIVDGDFFQSLLEKSREFRKGAADK